MNNRQEAPTFRSFDPNGNLEVNNRNLPHWFQAGAATFITIRTADSLPKRVIQQWQEELRRWLELNRLPEELANAVTSEVREEALDQLGRLDSDKLRQFKKLSDRLFNKSLDDCRWECLLRRSELAQIVSDAILFFDGRRYDVDRFVVMPNH